jgi:hypothetical protein
VLLVVGGFFVLISPLVLSREGMLLFVAIGEWHGVAARGPFRVHLRVLAEYTELEAPWTRQDMWNGPLVLKQA